MVTLEVLPLAEETPSTLRWNPKRDNVAAIGYKSGKISFVEVQTLQSMTMTLNPEETQGDPTSGVIDLAWDPSEDHLLAAFKDGSLCMIDFNGFNPEAT